MGTTVPGAFVGACRTGGSLGSADGSDDGVDGDGSEGDGVAPGGADSPVGRAGPVSGARVESLGGAGLGVASGVGAAGAGARGGVGRAGGAGASSGREPGGPAGGGGRHRGAEA
ncbi:hypothetical protein PV368_34685, partial [Streptomyces sp. ME02-6979A]|nr:hypothetical protein [Streptomyces sp. ME02-6979A]